MWFRVLAVVAFITTLMAIAIIVTYEGTIPADLRYEVINETTLVNEVTLSNRRRSLDVRLSRKVETEVLETLAVRLRDQATTRFVRTFIAYYLPRMEVGAGAWAITNFDPDLEVRILGTPAKDGSLLDRLRSEHGEALIGVWENNQASSSGTWAIFGTESGFGLERISPDGSVGRKVLVERPSQRGRRFADPENRFGEFYLIRGGNLELHDAPGEWHSVLRARPVYRGHPGQDGPG